MAPALLSVEITEYCQKTLQLNGCHNRVCLKILLECCKDVILGQNFQKLHDNIVIWWKTPRLVTCGLSTLFVQQLVCKSKARVSTNSC